ncbi:MAG: ABC transporter permease [Hyphomicrobiaceae bacterium]|nr:ABC transporter permease [Hyphomicrobiaceae bacterium]
MSGSSDRRDRPPPRQPGPYGDPNPQGYAQRGPDYAPRAPEPAPADAYPVGYEPFYDEAADPTQPAGRRPPPPRDPRAYPDAYGEPQAYTPEPPSVALPQAGGDLYAEARRGRKVSGAAIVPPGSVTGRSLGVVIAIMCFLACLTAGTVYMINRSADVWLKDMAAEVTLQVEPREGVDTERTLTDITAQLVRTPGVLNVRALSIQESAGLLEPWLGQAGVLKELPVPRLVAIELDPGSPPDLEALKQRLSAGYKGVTLDDHRHWQAQIRTVTRSLALGGFLILGLVGLATIAIIVSATRSAMASNSDIVEVLHFVGATDRFIAREFDKHFLKLGIKAGLAGASAAAVVFLCAPLVVTIVGGGESVTAAEIQRLVGTGSLDLAGYGLLGVVVVVVAVLCMVTSRLGVFNILNTRV